MLDKAMVFIWACWLLFGPSEAQFRFFLSHVVSFTTDMGTELVHVVTLRLRRYHFYVYENAPPNHFLRKSANAALVDKAFQYLIQWSRGVEPRR